MIKSNCHQVFYSFKVLIVQFRCSDSINYFTHHHSTVMFLNNRLSKIYKKMLSQEFLVFIILILLHYLFVEIKWKNTELVRDVVLSHSNLKGNSTQRQICYQRLEMKKRLLDVGVTFYITNYFLVFH